MRIKNYKKYCCFEYTSTTSEHYQLGDIVINNDNLIGVIIQIHDDYEYRTDMFGNCSLSEIRLATEDEIKEHRIEVYNHLQKENEITNILFRKNKIGQVLALFPYDIYNNKFNKNLTWAYTQEGFYSADLTSGILENTIDATKEEYESLYKKLIDKGYNLNVINK